MVLDESLRALKHDLNVLPCVAQLKLASSLKPIGVRKDEFWQLKNWGLML